MNLRIGLCVTLILAACSGSPLDLPEGWRLPTDMEMDGQSLRKESNWKYAQATADLDGDGKDDTAYLLKSTTSSGQGLWVDLSSRSGKDWLVLDEIYWGEQYPNAGLAMGIETVPPGTYESACGKRYWDCASDEPAAIELEAAALRYFKFESASSIFHWDAKTGAFIRTWTSD